MVNQLPQGWKEEELGNLFDITSSKRVFMADWKRTGVPFYRAREIVKLSENGWVDNELFISEEMYNEYAKKYGIPKENDIMITAVGTLGCVYVVKKNDRFYFKDGNIIWLKNRDIINSQYVKYYFQSPFIKRQIFDNSGAVVGTYTIIKAKQTKIFYPTDKSEQKYIVDTLDAVAEMIKLRKETIQLTKDLIPAIFQEMFGDCSENVLLGNNDYFEIEDGDRGNNYPKKEELLEKGDCLFLSAKNVTEDGFVFKENVFISQDKDKKLRTGKLKRHDFVMMTRGTIGNIAYYSPDIPYDNIRINSGMVIIRIKQGFEPLYFLQAMRSDNVKFQIRNLITGAAVPQLPIHLIKKISLKLADNTKQKEFADKVEQINQNLEVQQKDLDRLQELFDQLLQKAFTGELTRGEAYGKH